MARRNSEAYGVSHKVAWVRGDAFSSPIDKVGAVFLSPPWGGPTGARKTSFDATQPLPGVTWCVPATACIVLPAKLPCVSINGIAAVVVCARAVYVRKVPSSCPGARLCRQPWSEWQLTVSGACRSVKDSLCMACGRLSEASLQQEGAGADVPNIAVYLPRSTLISSLAECLGTPGFRLTPLCLERNVLNGQLKAATLYLRCSAAVSPGSGAT